MRRQRFLQPLHLVERNIGPGRIVRVREKNDFRPRRDGLQNSIHIRGKILFRRCDRFRPGAHGGDRVNDKAVRRVDRLVAVGEVGARKQVEQIVGAGAAHDAIGIEPERGADCVAQGRSRAVRVSLKVLAGYAIGRDRIRARPQRRLVGGKLEHLGDAKRGALARNVRGNLEHAGSRLRAVHRHTKSGRSGLVGGNRIAVCVAADEGCRAHGGAGLNQGSGD